MSEYVSFCTSAKVPAIFQISPMVSRLRIALSIVATVLLLVSGVAATATAQVVTQCNDGIDNDGDGIADFGNPPATEGDFSCFTASDNDETNPRPECNDGVDNDGDGRVDFPGDAGCSTKNSNREQDMICPNNGTLSLVQETSLDASNPNQAGTSARNGFTLSPGTYIVEYNEGGWSNAANQWYGLFSIASGNVTKQVGVPQSFPTRLAARNNANEKFQSIEVTSGNSLFIYVPDDASGNTGGPSLFIHRCTPPLVVADQICSQSISSLRTLSGLQSVTVYETSRNDGIAGANNVWNIPVNDARLTSDINEGIGNADFTTAASEYYDFFYSDNHGVLNTNGSYFTIDAFHNANVQDGHTGNNIDAVALNFADGTVAYADLIAHTALGSGLGTTFQQERGYAARALGAPNGIVTAMGSQHSRLTLGFCGAQTAPSVDIKINGSDGTIAVAPGSVATLTWTSSGVQRCDTGTSNMPGWGSFESLPLSGSRQVTVSQSGTYGIQCARSQTSNMTVQDNVGVTFAQSSSSSVPVPQCRDGIDNDGDGATDFNGGDFSCSNGDDADETNPRAACQDGVDNDGDGVSDSNDSGCHSDGNVNNFSSYNRQDNDESNQITTATPHCQDGIDNDGDGAADFPADFSCANASDNDETNPRSQCQDFVDNDGDGLIDSPQDPGCTNKQDNDESNVGALSVTKTDNRTTVRPGDIVTYTITIRNSSSVQATNVSVTDTLPANVSFLSATEAGIVNGQTVSWFGLTVPAFSLRTLTIQARVSSTVSDGSVIINTAFVNGNNAASDTTVVDSDDNGGNGDEDVTINVTDTPDPVECNELLQYLIRVRNNENDDIRVRVTVDLPKDVIFLSATDGGRELSDDIVIWDLDIDEDETRTVRLEVRVRGEACDKESLQTEIEAGDERLTVRTDVDDNGNGEPECDDDIDNDHDGDTDYPEDNDCDSRNDDDEGDNQSGAQCDDNIDNDGDGTIDYPADPDCSSRFDNSERATATTGTVSVQKFSDRTEAYPGDQLTYTVTVRNDSAVASSSVVVEDNFPTYQLTIVDPGTGVVNGNRIEWRIASLGAFETRILTYRAQVSASLRHGDSIRNSVRVTGGNIVNNPTTISDVRIVERLPQTGFSDFTKPFNDPRGFLSPIGGSASVPAIFWTALMLVGTAFGAQLGKKYFL